ncbi:RNA polymerase sigma-70 factor (ECF subfamily) [Streptomyces sp. 846.5]|nr:sigma-70 family RNA polymerase sigma factor [Streptomyces sp. 846.5]TDT97952.1 RNA polymerase sigma-70 factor (ECF subfamily) [Streptomyces sp. 846.5]
MSEPEPQAEDEPGEPAEDPLARTVRIEGTRILATLVRTVGDLRLAEDAVQEATIAALRDWPRSGVPDSPRAWLTVTARRKAVDSIRREGLRASKEREATALMDLDAPEPTQSVVRDDHLRLIFTCCHPALAADARVALALRTLCGLSTAEVAAVLLTSEPAMAKRLTRTRQKIRQARIPYRIPAADELPARLAAVCAVVHALYTSGHTRPSGDRLTDVDMCTEAIRLARMLLGLLPDQPQPQALLALLLLTEARRPARTSPGGEVVLLADQDRTRWDQAAIAEGLALLTASLDATRGQADPGQLQAAIAAQHALAATALDTDWAEILRLYDLLLSVQPGNSAAALGRTVALAHAHGPAAGLAALDALPPTDHDHRRHAIRAELLAQQHRFDEAVEAMRRSLTTTLPDPERAHRLRRIAHWTTGHS